MLISEFVQVRWGVKNRELYTLKGYTKNIDNNYMTVKVLDISPNSNIKIKLKCDGYQCENIKDVRFSDYINSETVKKFGIGAYFCRSCAIKVHHTKSHYDFLLEVYDLVEDTYSVLNEYKSAKLKVKFKHNICNFEFDMTPDDFLNGHRCSKCAGNTKKTTEEFESEIFKLVFNEYELISKYESCQKKVEMRHTICGSTYFVTPNGFLNGRRCPVCAGNKKKTTEEFKKEVFDLTGDNFSVLGKYFGANKKIKMKHNECNFEWDVNPSSFLMGSRCPNCNESKGEKKIGEYLISNNYFFIPQYKIDDCKNKYTLPFDFVILNHSDDALALIEYDGVQHYEPIKHFGGEEYLRYIQQNDQIKNTYCQQNKIPLLRIPYWEYDNIEEILKTKLYEFGIKEAS